MARRKPARSRWFLKTLLVVVLLLLALSFGKNWLLQRAIEHQATATLGVPVRVDSVNLQLLAGTFSLSGLSIANPKGFTSPHLLHLGEVEAKIQLDSITKPLMVIDNLQLRHISIYYEIGTAGTNLAVLEKSLRPTKSAGAKKQQAGTQAPPSGRQWRIALLQIVDASVVPNVRIGGQSVGERVSLADIELRDLGSDRNGMNNAELASIILGTIAKNAGQKLPSSMIEKGLGNIGKGLRDIGRGVLGR